MKNFFSIIILSLAVIFFTQTAFCLEIPGRTRYKVNDYVGVIDAPTKDYLENYLKEFRKRHKKIEIEATILPSLDGMSFDVFMREYAYKWRRIWPFDNEHRVHFVVFVNDHRMRFGIGYALDKILTKEVAKHIVDDIVVPEFKNGRYGEGIKKGIESMVKLLDERSA